MNKDTIYRQAAVDAVNAYLGLSAVSRTIQNMTSIQEILENLPSVEPRKKGKWELRTDEIFDIDYYKCSECGYEPYRKMDISNFCPNCGADMRGENNE